ncbi:hypothetical protein H7I92_04125, partial [Mycobacterium riyadhense]|nr:hypothetical protein [Mycobacterium riyadhense]
ANLGNGNAGNQNIGNGNAGNQNIVLASRGGDTAPGVAEVVAGLDTSGVHAQRRVGGTGRAGYDPDMLLTLLIWAWAQDVAAMSEYYAGASAVATQLTHQGLQNVNLGIGNKGTANLGNGNAGNQNIGNGNAGNQNIG